MKRVPLVVTVLVFALLVAGCNTAPSGVRQSGSATPVVAVPSVGGMDLGSAVAALEASGLKAGTTTADFSLAASGTVASQSPSAGVEVAAGSDVTLVLSKGPRSLAVPSAIGNTQSDATALLESAGFPGDTNGSKDIFLRDLTAGTTTRLSVNSSGEQSNGTCGSVDMTPDGRYVVFASDATNLVPGDTNGLTDVFARDVMAGRTTLASVSNTGVQADGVSWDCSISANGRYVAFVSDATSLVPGDTNGEQDVFVRDLVKGTTTRVSVSNTGTQADYYSQTPDISSDGGHVVFVSEATNLVSGDTNGRQDVFVRDIAKRTTTRASVSGTGAQGDLQSQNTGISSDGRYVVFASLAKTLVPGDTNEWEDVFVRDLEKGTTTRVSVSSSGAQVPAGGFSAHISSDGRFVAFESNADDLVSGDTNRRTDIFVRDIIGGTTARASLGADGAQGNGGSGSIAISSDGRYVVFDSGASNLVPGDTNRVSDAFLRDMGVPSKAP